MEWVIRRRGSVIRKRGSADCIFNQKRCWEKTGLILLEQLKGILEEVGVLLESLGSLLENRRSPWQEVCSFSYIRAGEEGHRVLLEQLSGLLEQRWPILDNASRILEQSGDLFEHLRNILENRLFIRTNKNM